MSGENKHTGIRKSESMLQYSFYKALGLHPLHSVDSRDKMRSVCGTAKDNEIVHVSNEADGIAFLSFRFIAGEGAWENFSKSKMAEKMMGVFAYQVEEHVKVGDKLAFLDVFYDETGFMRVALCGYASKDDDLATFLFEDILNNIEKAIAGKEPVPTTSPKEREKAVRAYVAERKGMKREIDRLRRDQFSDQR